MARARTTVQDQLRFMEQSGLDDSSEGSTVERQGKAGNGQSAIKDDMQLEDWNEDERNVSRVTVPEEA